MSSTLPAHSPRTAASACCLALLAIALTAHSGCGIASNLMHGLGVDMIPADYEGLEDSKVAVVTVTDGSQYSKDAAVNELDRMVSEILVQKVDDVSLVRQEDIEHWKDINGWDAIEFTKIGETVGADKVVAIELADLKLREGKTLFRGRSSVVVKVIDVATDSIEYQRTLEEFLYPTVAGQSVSETTENRFRRLYLSMLAAEIGRSFHPYDLTDRFALDSAIARH